MSNAPFSLFLAFRYLKPKRTFLSTITLISIIGVMLGITVLIVVISVMTGFDQELRRKVLGFQAHLLVTSDAIIDDWRPLSKQIAEMPDVVATAPFVQGPVIVAFQDRRLAPKMRGIDPKAEDRVTDIEGAIVDGKFDLDGDSTILGAVLAQALGVRVGDTIVVYSPGNIGDLLDAVKKAETNPEELQRVKELVFPAELKVTGIFETGRFEYDSDFLLVPLYVGQELYGLHDGVQGIAVRTSEAYKAVDVKRSLLEKLPPPLTADTWIDLNHQLFDAIRLERNVMFIILMFLIVIASFCVMSNMITVTVQKTREIGLMKALGASTAQIVWVFLAQGMVVGIFGNASGLLFGITLVHYRNEFKEWLARTLNIEIFPADVYQFSQIPAEIVPHDVATICISAFIICSLATLAPAYFAATLDPVKALRRE